MNNATATILATLHEVADALDRGYRVFCEWGGKHPMMTMPGEVIRIEGDRVLFRHWGDCWCRVGDAWIRLVVYG
ncbi:hypothetical protein [Kordiimonas sp.]|uniref:hypothetical protein n=1 Tax=Kordiimonas sp. TaxID=1970157 RepID=UPI003A921AAE